MAEQGLGRELKDPTAEVLDDLTDLLVREEAALADAQAELAAFTYQYALRFAALYTAVDRLELAVAERLARKEPTPEATKDVREARARAEASERQRTRAAEEPAPTPSEECRRLFRQAAKLFHPDLAVDDADRARRSRLFVLAKEAFDRGDTSTLEEMIAREGEALRPGLGAVNAIDRDRRIQRIRQRLTELSELRRELEGDPMWSLMQRVRAAAQAGVDLLTQVEEELISRRLFLQRRLTKDA
jgi:hypothetical protein